ncbi:MAG: HAD family phosphatase [Candidatus Micrarchaeota archaeon]|nr:HAD family phosphatase [Candidatus Micrarchaeota archaeon]
MAADTKCVMFDMFDVVIYYTTDMHYRYIASKNGLGFGLVKGRMDVLERELDSGSITVREYVSKAARRLGIHRKGVYYPYFFERSIRPNRPMIRLVKRLRKRYKTALMTNAGFLEYRLAKELIGFGGFDYVFASCYLGMIKPSPRLFRYAAKRMSLDPPEITFVDDRERNVVAARKVGMDAILFRGNEDFRRQLARRGLA